MRLAHLHSELARIRYARKYARSTSGHRALNARRDAIKEQLAMIAYVYETRKCWPASGFEAVVTLHNPADPVAPYNVSFNRFASRSVAYKYAKHVAEHSARANGGRAVSKREFA
jgi:hypothetical protein